MFDLGRYDMARHLYQEVAWRYQQEPTGLWAYVQIINCNLRVGAVHEARTNLERVRWLLRRMPVEAFAGSPPKHSRADWERFFDWAARIPLLADEPARPPVAVH